jgi:hypothetical protein
MPVEHNTTSEGIDPAPVSPTPVKKVEMLDFMDAIREVLNGKRVTRVSWEDVNVYIFLANDFLCIDMGNSVHQLVTSLGDMQGLDWYVLPEKGQDE